MKIKIILITLLLLLSFNITQGDVIPSTVPVISDVNYPLQEVINNYVNITCNIYYANPLKDVTVNITGPVGYGNQTHNMTGIKDSGGELRPFWYGENFTAAGSYSFHIYANNVHIPMEQTETVEYHFSIFVADILVDDNANESWYNATQVATIQEGIDNATEGNTIYVYDGAYSDFVVNKTLILKAESNLAIVVGSISIQNQTEFYNFAVNGHIYLEFSLAYIHDCNISGGINLNYSSATIENNYIDGGACGVDMFHSHGTIVSNTISNCGIGINISDDESVGNSIYWNNFIDNSLQAFDPVIFEEDNLWDSGRWGNYWNDYSDFDNNSDGILDHPYEIQDGESKDRYPLAGQWFGTPPDPIVVYIDDDYNVTTSGWGYDYFDNIGDGLDGLSDDGLNKAYVYAGVYAPDAHQDPAAYPDGWAVDLIGEDKDTTIIDANNTGRCMEFYSAWPVTVSNITFRNSGSWSTGPDWDAGLAFGMGWGPASGDHVVVKDCIFENCYMGVYFSGFDYCEVTNCEFRNMQDTSTQAYCVRLGGNYNSINNCTSTYIGDAFALIPSWSYNNTIADNYIDLSHSTGQFGIWIASFTCHDNLITRNEFRGNSGILQFGVYINWYFGWQDSYNNYVYYNNFFDCTAEDDPADGTVVNYFDNNGIHPNVRGNYWSDYLSKYPDAHQIYPYFPDTSFGYWSKPYILDDYYKKTKDDYPQIKPYVLFAEPWDIIIDGVINYLDVSALTSKYGHSGSPGWIREDINDDGIVNYLDISILVSHYGESY